MMRVADGRYIFFTFKLLLRQISFKELIMIFNNVNSNKNYIYITYFFGKGGSTVLEQDKFSEKMKTYL